MKARLFRSKRQGQSIILIALIIVVLVGMVGLSVDVGNTYAQNRNAVRSTNAAALAAMDKLIRGGADSDVGAVLKASFQSNGITAQIDPSAAPQPGERRIEARYLDSNGVQLGACTVGSCGTVPANVAYIQVNTTGTVDTYFARVLGQQTLPVKAQAFAAQCTPVNGVYPIAINAADMGSNGFLPPTVQSEKPYYGTYSDETYQNKTQRRIYRKTNFGTPGSFDWLQWSTDPGAGNAVDLANMLANDGDLDLGFKEVDPWPNPNVKAPTGYPLYPGQLTDGDWIPGNTGNTNSNAVRDALDYHVKYHTEMNLPIVDQAVSQGQNTAFHFVRLGKFYLREYKLTTNESYFDLVYIGQADKKACLNTNVNQGLKGLGLVGPVYVNPRWTVNQPPAQPIAYNIVLDVSGSMSWDFNGYGTYDGSNKQNGYASSNSITGNVQCESPDNPNPSNYQYTDRCIGGRNSAWYKENERRIYVAKNAIKNFIDRMGPYDMMRVIAFSTSEPSGNATASGAWSSDKVALKSIVSNAGRYNGQEYLTDGGTPGPQALDKASKMFLASNGYTPTAPNGLDYKPVVIYLTDGVANVFLNGNTNDARDICGNMSPAQARTTADPCQLGPTSNGTLRPISAMVDIAYKMRASMSKLEIYAIGLAQVPDTGLPKVANDTSYYYPATQSNVVDNILTTIQARAGGATCTAGGGFNWVNTIDAAHTPASPPAPGVFGYVSIFEVGSSTAKYKLPIQNDPSTSRLGFSIPPPDPSNPASAGITPGTYQMEAYILYKGTDNITRSYNWFTNQNLSETQRITFSVSSAAALGSSVPISPIFLDLASNLHVCPVTP